MTTLKKWTIILANILLWCACTKPTENIKVVIDTNIIKYTVLLHVTDAANNSNPPPGLTMTVTGTNANDIYEISGTKNFSITSGIITIGPAPTLVPTTSNPVQFNVVLSAPGYTTVTYAVQINPGDSQQIISVSMAKVNTGGGGVTVTPVAQTSTAPSTTPITINFIGTCPNNSNFELHPSNYIFYRVTGSTTGYQYLGYMSAGVLTANLVLGTTYDFEITYNGVNYSVTQTITQTSYSETLNLGTALCNTL